MCDGNEHEAVKVTDQDLERVRELRQVARDALIESNRILAKYMGVDADSIDSVTIGLNRKGGQTHDDGSVPPVQICTQYNSGGACAYEECDPPGVTRPCIQITLKP
jgi:hypothetical protein